MHNKEEDEVEKTFFFNFVEEWSQWFTPCNWYDFHFFTLWFENDWKFGHFDFKFYILGLGFEILWVYKPDTEFKKQIVESAQEALKEWEETRKDGQE